jgi:hypothetical protein
MSGKSKESDKKYSPNWGGDRGKEPSVRRSVPITIVDEVDRIISEYKESKKSN